MAKTKRTTPTPGFELGDVRPVRGSKNTGFEEFICQLYRDEERPERFRRIDGRGGDAGVELIEIDKRGRAKAAWQAKYYSTFGETQCRHIRTSIETAMAAYPTIRSYYVCIPIILTAKKRIKGGRWTGGQWGLWEKLQKALAKRLGKRKVVLICGDQIESHVIKKEAVLPGFSKHWFGNGALTVGWLSRHKEQCKATLSAVYDPALNVSTPLTAALDAFAMKKTWIGKCRSHLDVLFGRIEKLVDYSHKHNAPVSAHFIGIRKAATEAKRSLSLAVPFPTPDKLISTLSPVRRLIEDSYEDAENSESRAHNKRVSACVEWFDSVIDKSYGSVDFSAHTKMMIVTGNAGSGKTHHFATLAVNHDPRQTVILAQGRFLDGTGLALLNSIPESLGLHGDTFEDLVTGLNALGFASGNQSVLAIDAINESPGWRNWEDALVLAVGFLKGKDHLRIVTSVRPEYADIICAKVSNNPLVTRIEHDGFRSVTEEAIDLYMAHYRIQRPATVALRAIASDPLFLRLFCESIAGGSLHEAIALSNPHGITGHISRWLEWIEKNRIAPKIESNPSSRMVRSAIVQIAAAMIQVRSAKIPATQALAITQALHPVALESKSLFSALKSEGILTTTIERVDGDETIEIVGFSFQRLFEWASAHWLIGRWGSAEDCKNDGALRMLLGFERQQEPSAPPLTLPGILDILCVLYVAKFGREIVEVLPVLNSEITVGGDYHGPKLTFIDRPFSLSISARTSAVVTSHFMTWLDRRLDSGDLLAWDELIRCSCLEGHHFAASSWLHPRLLAMDMLQRDAYWSTIVGYLYEPMRVDRYSRRAIGRFDRRVSSSVIGEMLGWLERSTDAMISSLSRSSVFEMCIVLGWLLASSHRYVRDRASMALARVMYAWPDHARELLERFASCGDPYIIERLLAAIYGALLRGQHALSRAFDERIMKQLMVDPYCNDINIRDFIVSVDLFLRKSGGAGLVNERSVTFGRAPVLEFDSLPSRAELNALCARDDAHGLSSSSLSDIDRSLTDQMGDFANYSIYEGKKFTKHVVDAPHPHLKTAISDLSSSTLKSLARCAESNGEVSPDKFDSRKSYEEAVEYLNPPQGSLDRADAIDAEDMQAIVLAPIVKLYEGRQRDTAKIDDYDRVVDSCSRDCHKAERIGKKYQWLSYRRALCSLSDNYWRCDGSGKHSRWTRDTEAWSLCHREIDCSLTGAQKAASDEEEKDVEARNWWDAFSFDKKVMQGSANPDEWRRTSGLQLVKRWSPVRVDPTSKRTVILLRQSGEHSGNLRGDSGLSLKRVNFATEAILVEEGASDLALSTLQRKSFMNRGFFHGGRVHSAFLGEWPWHPMLMDEDYVPKVDGHFPYREAAVGFYKEAGYDCSHEESFHVGLPAREFFSAGELAWSGIPGDYRSGGRPAFYDPAMTSRKETDAIVIDQGFLRAHLTRSKSSLICIGIAEWWFHTEEPGRSIAWGVTCIATCVDKAGREKGYAQQWSLASGTELLEKQCAWAK